MDEHCGRFAIQLDSDDLYINHHVLQRIVDTFHEHQCAMVIGSYKMVNFKLEEIPPGIIDHKEWTPDNGVTTPYASTDWGLPVHFTRHYSGKSESRTSVTGKITPRHSPFLANIGSNVSTNHYICVAVGEGQFRCGVDIQQCKRDKLLYEQNT